LKGNEYESRLNLVFYRFGREKVREVCRYIAYKSLSQLTTVYCEEYDEDYIQLNNPEGIQEKAPGVIDLENRVYCVAALRESVEVDEEVDDDGVEYFGFERPWGMGSDDEEGDDGVVEQGAKPNRAGMDSATSTDKPNLVVIEFGGAGDEGELFLSPDDPYFADALEVLDQIDDDWCRGGGGGGTITFDLTAGTVVVDGYYASDAYGGSDVRPRIQIEAFFLCGEVRLV